MNCTITQVGTIQSEKHHRAVQAVQNFEARALCRQSFRGLGCAPRCPFPGARSCSQAGALEAERVPRKIELLGFLRGAISRWKFSGCCPVGSASTRSGGSPNPPRHKVRHCGSESGPPLGVPFAGFFLRPRPVFSVPATLIRQAERDDATLANSIGARGKFLDFVRIQIATALDDDVLHAPGDVDFPRRRDTRGRPNSPTHIPRGPLPGRAAAALRSLWDYDNTPWWPKVRETTRILRCDRGLRRRVHSRCELRGAAKLFLKKRRRSPFRPSRGAGNRTSLRRKRLAFDAIHQRGRDSAAAR